MLGLGAREAPPRGRRVHGALRGRRPAPGAGLDLLHRGAPDLHGGHLKRGGHAQVAL